MRVDVVRLARRVLVLVVVSGLPALAVAAPSGWPSAANVASHASSSGFEGIRLTNVAGRLGLDFRQGAFRFGVSPDPAAMTGPVVILAIRNAAAQAPWRATRIWGMRWCCSI